MVDNYWDSVEVSQLKDTTSTAIIDFLKQQFSRHGIPHVLISDNRPQFTSREITRFAREWEFKHVTSSPYHRKPKGKTESAVYCKEHLQERLPRQSRPLVSDVRSAKYANAGHWFESSKKVHVAKNLGLVPVSSTILYPKEVEGVKENLERKRKNDKSYVTGERGSCRLLKLVKKSALPMRRRRDGTCVEKLSDPSYIVQAKGETMLRNREALRPKRVGDTTILSSAAIWEFWNGKCTT